MLTGNLAFGPELFTLQLFDIYAEVVEFYFSDDNALRIFNDPGEVDKEIVRRRSKFVPDIPSSLDRLKKLGKYIRRVFLQGRFPLRCCSFLFLLLYVAVTLLLY